MKKMSVRRLTLHALLMGLTVVTTMMIAIPSIATKGYVNLGDAMVLLSSWLLGPLGGAVVGGVGSTMADLLLGYVHYMPVTLVVKGLEGFFAAMLLRKLKVHPLLTGVAAGLWMACGYFLAESFMYGSGAAWASLPGNVVQGLTGAVFATLLYPLLRRLPLVAEPTDEDSRKGTTDHK